MRENKFRPLAIVLLTLVFAMGLFIFLYPYFRGAVIDREIQEHAQDFQSCVKIQPTTSTVIIDTTEPTEEILYPDLWADMTTYNETIYAEGQSGLSCAYDYQKPSFILADYGLEDEVFGVISIPAMDLNMPIFLGATEKHMADGAAHMSQTSLPIGGNNTNCVIAGHRGYGGASYFRYIEKLQIGDTVSITNLWETLEYRVVQIKIIYPYQVEEILIQEGRDLLTLLTCHPYASGGKQRYLVICERVNQHMGWIGIAMSSGKNLTKKRRNDNGSKKLRRLCHHPEHQGQRYRVCTGRTSQNRNVRHMAMQER